MQNEMHSRSYLVSGARNMLSLILRRASGHARIFKAQSRSNYQNVFFCTSLMNISNRQVQR